MAGKPLRKRILADIAKRGGADYLFDQLASGKTLTKLAAEYECSREYLSKSIHAIPEYSSAVDKARKAAADALVEGQLYVRNICHTRESPVAQVYGWLV